VSAIKWPRISGDRVNVRSPVLLVHEVHGVQSQAVPGHSGARPGHHQLAQYGHGHGDLSGQGCQVVQGQPAAPLYADTGAGAGAGRDRYVQEQLHQAPKRNQSLARGRAADCS
jgi:hypothetical protein